jgi:hypothetical protein
MVQKFSGWRLTPHNHSFKKKSNSNAFKTFFGTSLYYESAVDPKLQAALSAIALRQVNGTQAVADACHHSLITLPVTLIPESATKHAT